LVRSNREALRASEPLFNRTKALYVLPPSTLCDRIKHPV